MYQKVIDALILFSCEGYKNFETAWTCQTETYSKALIMDKECRYFTDAYIKGYLNQTIHFDDFIDEFDYISDKALAYGRAGLMHRDFQSRNIMIKQNAPYLIDYQSARVGPIQYDLASLLIDPYVDLDDQFKEDLIVYTVNKLALKKEQVQPFIACYKFCCLTRNLQILGAFGFLTRIKKKKKFESYIPNAIKSLKKIVHEIGHKNIPRLARLANRL
jgi:aminoglycoside/choline kinase family phosphotransferase